MHRYQEFIKSNWWRMLGTFVVAACAIWTAWYQTHQPPPIITATKATQVTTVTKVVRVNEGDGYVTDAQCHTIKNGTKKSEIRKRFGYPADADTLTTDDYAYSYPIRGDKDRVCRVSFWGRGDDVDGVTLDLT